jgi:hypothetical protein
MSLKNDFFSLLSFIDCEGGLNCCWPWLSGTNSFGYGRISINNKRCIVHIEMYKHFYGPISPGNVVRHSCDNRRCCNPLHLSQGTQKENVQDMVERDRIPNKISTEIVIEMEQKWKSGYTQRQLAKQFGYHQGTISNCFKRLGIRKM